MCRGQAVILDYLNIIKELKKIKTTVPERQDIKWSKNITIKQFYN